MNRVKKLASYLENNKVEATMFAEALILMRDDVVHKVLINNIEDGHSYTDPLPWERILSEIEDGLRKRVEVEKFVEEVQEERRKIGIKWELNE